MERKDFLDVEVMLSGDKWQLCRQERPKKIREMRRKLNKKGIFNVFSSFFCSPLDGVASTSSSSSSFQKNVNKEINKKKICFKFSKYSQKISNLNKF